MKYSIISFNFSCSFLSDPTIEEVTDEILKDLIDDHEYVVAYFTGPCEEGDKCDSILGMQPYFYYQRKGNQPRAFNAF